MSPNKPPAKSIRLLTALVVIVGPLGVALLASLITDIGRDAKSGYLAVIPQVIPVIFLASFLETRASVARDAAAGELSPRLRTVTRDAFRLLVWLFIAAEGIALYALASDTSTTFTVFAPLIASVELLLMMLNDAASAVGVAPSGRQREAHFQRAVRERLVRMAESLEARAERLRAEAEEDEERDGVREGAEPRERRLADEEDPAEGQSHP